MNDNKRAELIGERTLGRAGIQKLVRLPEGRGLWLTYARYLTPNGNPIQGRGLEPDVAVDEPDVEFGAPAPEKDLDPRRGARTHEGESRRLGIDTAYAAAYNRTTSLVSRILAALGQQRGLATSPASEAFMNKQELISKIAEDTGLTKTNAAAAVDSFIQGVTKSLKKGQPITFVGFGTFKTAQRKARTARNLQTGAAIKIPKRRVVRFTAGKALKSAVN